MDKLLVGLMTVAGASANLLGAFGAHGLKTKLSPHMLKVFQTGVQYQFYHSLVLGLVVIFYFLKKNRIIRLSGLCFFFSMILFSGSLYAIAITGEHWLGILTPIGGVSFILSWITLGVGLWSN